MPIDSIFDVHEAILGRGTFKKELWHLIAKLGTELAWKVCVHMLRKISSLLLLLLDERSDDGDVCVKNRSKLLPADHFNQGLFVGLRHLSRLLQILEVFVLTLQVVSQILHVLQRDNPLQEACRL